MTFTKTAAVATLALAAAIGSTMTAAHAGKKHHHHLHHHHLFHKKHHVPLLIIGSHDYEYGCKRWLRLYKKTGKQRFLNRYYDCIY